MTLTDIASIAEIIGIIAILYGLIFGTLQLKQNRAQRRDLAILECTRLFEDQEFTDAYRTVQELPGRMTRSEFDALEEGQKSAVIRIAMKFETIGMLVHRGVVPLDAMEELVGGSALHTWRVLEAYIKETRQISSNAMFMEWYQWLVEQLEKRQSHDRQPAFVAHADWQEPTP